jgi:hypothetical protein
MPVRVLANNLERGLVLTGQRPSYVALEVLEYPEPPYVRQVVVWSSLLKHNKVIVIQGLSTLCSKLRFSVLDRIRPKPGTPEKTGSWRSWAPTACQNPAVGK